MRDSFDACLYGGSVIQEVNEQVLPMIQVNVDIFPKGLAKSRRASDGKLWACSRWHRSPVGVYDCAFRPIYCEGQPNSQCVAVSKGVATAIVNDSDLDFDDTVRSSEWLDKIFIDHITYVYAEIEEAKWGANTMSALESWEYDCSDIHRDRKGTQRCKMLRFLDFISVDGFRETHPPCAIDTSNSLGAKQNSP
jgi:hypothetical protein